MKYYKVIENEKIAMIGTQHNNILSLNSIEITEEEYNTLLAEFEEHQAKVSEYVQKVRSGEITLDEVPTEYKREVEEIINIEPTYSEDYLAGYDRAVMDLLGVE